MPSRFKSRAEPAWRHLANAASRGRGRRHYPPHRKVKAQLPRSRLCGVVPRAGLPVLQLYLPIISRVPHRTASPWHEARERSCRSNFGKKGGGECWVDGVNKAPGAVPERKVGRGRGGGGTPSTAPCVERRTFDFHDFRELFIYSDRSAPNDSLDAHCILQLRVRRPVCLLPWPSADCFHKKDRGALRRISAKKRLR